MTIMLVRAAMLVALLAPLPVLAQEHWELVPGTMTSALLARSEGWRVVTSSGLSWPDGRQAVVSFWTNGTMTIRCTDYFEADMSPTGGLCAQAVPSDS